MTSPRSIAAAEGRLVRANLLLCCAAAVSVPAAALALLPSTQAVLIAIKNAATLATGNSQVRSDSAFVSGKPSSVPISSWLPAAGAGLRKAACQWGSRLRGFRIVLWVRVREGGTGPRTGLGRLTASGLQKNSVRKRAKWL